MALNPTLGIIELDNSADTLITLRISGNRLVSVCNALQSLLRHSADCNDDTLNETVEGIRDQLSAQRCLASRAKVR